MRLRTLGGLWVEQTDDRATVAPRPRSLALLALLASGRPTGTSRDRVIGVLWPESSPERARHVLSQTVYGLRKELGVEVVLSAPDLRLDPDRITSDVEDLRRAVREKDWATAAQLYAGPFLSGFYLSDAPEFERWVESERAALDALGAQAIEIVAESHRAAGRMDAAADEWRRLTRLDPVNARAALAYMETLAATGDRTGALAHGKAYAETLRRELDAEVDADVARLMARLRAVESTTPEPARADIVPNEAPHAPLVRHRRRSRLLLAAAAMLFAVLGAIGWRAAIARGSRPVLAVGRIRDYGTNDAGGVSNAMLATSLGRLPELQVIATSRMLELTPAGTDTSHVAVSDAARRAGATEMIEGELTPVTGGRLQLDLRRVALGTGRIRAAYRITGADRIELFDSATPLITADLGVGAPRGSLAEVSTRSPVAFRLYEEGLRRYGQSDLVGARRLFAAAAREDSTFAMAQYYVWRCTSQVPDAERALRLATRASDRDAVLIRTHIGLEFNDLRAVAAAESLAARFPRDPEALVRAAEVAPDLAKAIALANRSIALDSAANAPTAAWCRMCEAFDILRHRYDWADSSAAVERTVRRWMARRPDDFQPWGWLADYYVGTGHRAEADSAWARAESLGQPVGDDLERRLTIALRVDDLASADSLCATGLTTADVAAFMNRRWYCTLTLRMEGRYAEALALARDGRVPRSALVRHDATVDGALLAIVQAEAGHARAAADRFLAYARASAAEPYPPALRARHTTWQLTLAALASIDAGDTLRAHDLADSIEVLGRQSLYGRDPLLHHAVRGTLLARAHRDGPAARELRASIYSATNGFTRANYELGRAMLALGRPADGVAVVRSALRGGIEGSGLYITRTELHALLGALFDAAGTRDSAIVHYAIAERAWRATDPSRRARYDTVRRSLARLGYRDFNASAIARSASGAITR